MRRPLAWLGLVLACSGIVAAAARAQGVARAAAPVANGAAPASQAAVSSDKEAEALLRRAQSAAQRLSYAGTFVYQQGSQVRTSRITHLLDGRNELEKLELLDGRPREYIRTNEDIVCYLPESRTLLLEKRVTNDVFPAIVSGRPEDLAEHYTIRRGGAARIAGYEADSVQLSPRDKLRYGYTLWTERGSGLPLRVQTLADNNEVVEQITFTQLEIGRIDRSRVKPSVADTRNWRTENAVVQGADLSGWSVRSVPAGFRRIGEIRRRVIDSGLSEGHAKGPARREVSQIVFSDGLSAISVFIEPASQSKTEGSVRQGAMNIVGKRQGDFWLTIVGEAPAEAIRQVANSIEFKPAK
ncbi:MAG: putative negative regulator of sigma [Paucimonas sp.]|jgi:sigma-E factor negative regulatory protein RseB|nr:putative negative regulator of sigma [Paucimonas sp.]